MTELYKKLCLSITETLPISKLKLRDIVNMQIININDTVTNVNDTVINVDGDC